MDFPSLEFKIVIGYKGEVQSEFGIMLKMHKEGSATNWASLFSFEIVTPRYFPTLLLWRRNLPHHSLQLGWRLIQSAARSAMVAMFVLYMVR